jgi:hypothetical protein
MGKIFLIAGLLCFGCLSVSASLAGNAGPRGLTAGQGQTKQSKAEKERERDKLASARMLCAIVSKFFESGMNGYEAIKTARDFEDSDNHWVAYDSGLVFPGATRCIVYTNRLTGSDSHVSCTMSMPGNATSDEAVRRWNQSVVDAIKPCIPKNWVVPSDGLEHPEGYFSMAAGARGPRIQVQPAPPGPGQDRELHIDFYPK